MRAQFELILAPLLLIGSVVGQGTPPGEIRDVAVARNGSGTQVQVNLSAAVQPKVIVASNPPRLVLEFDGVLANAKQQQIAVGQDGIKSIRIGLHSATPPVTRVIVDLETARPYDLASTGNSIILTVLPAAVSHGGSGAPGAAGVPLFGRLHPHKHSTPSVADTVIPVPVPPAAPSGPPITIAQAPSPAQTTQQSPPAIVKPSAAHPNRGSLQEGTVFPSMGEPGTGIVPPTASTAANSQQSTSTAAAATSGAGQPTVTTTATVVNLPQPTSTATQAVHQPAAQPISGTSTARMGKQPSTQPLSATAGTSTAATTGMTVPPSPPTTTKQEPVQQAVAQPVITSPSASTPPSLPHSSTTAATVVNTPQPASTIAQDPVQQASTQPVPAVAPIQVTAKPVTTTNPTALATSAAPTTNVTANVTPAPANPPAVVQPSPLPSTAINTGGGSSTPALPVPSTTTASAQQPAVKTQVAQASPSNTDAEPKMPVLTTRQPNSDVRTAFKIKYVAEGAAYLDAGRSAGLSEGMRLEVRDTDPSTAQPAGDESGGLHVVAQLKIISVAETSAVAEISEPTRDVKAGDLAYLSSEDTESLVAQRSLSPTRKYPTVISFTEGDPLEEEARNDVPRPPLPEVNRARGRIGFDYSGIASHGTFSSTSSNIGMVIRTDVTRIGGSYWNMSGYWRGRFTSNSGVAQPTLQDLLNRTYTLGLTYDNPKSAWVAGVGRLYLPWATSLDTLDGGYIGRRVSDIATVGVFAGSTPDPTSWSYAPDQQISGTFVNFQGGSFDDFHYSSTSGLGLQMLKWKINRPFAFFENGLYYKRYFSIYNALQADHPASNPVVTSPGTGIARSFTTLRIQPFDRLEFDVNHTYFRDVPTFAPQLIGTGLLDKYLFQGFSAGPRIEVVKQIWVYATLGKSNRSGESKSSLNQLYGITFGDLPFRFRADVRYSRFNSSFGDGDYKAISLSRNFHDNFRWELLAGQQSYMSGMAGSNKSKFLNANIEAPLGPHYFLQGGWTINRGGNLNYDQWFGTFGYRFDSWHRGAK